MAVNDVAHLSNIFSYTIYPSERDLCSWGAWLMNKQIVLGHEYDERLRQIIKDVLRDIGGVVAEKSWGIGGSQEISELKIKVGESVVTLESETFIGLSIEGEASLIDRIEAAVNERMAGPHSVTAPTGTGPTKARR